MIYYTHHTAGRTVRLKGKDYLYFGGTSYLGLPGDPEFQSALIENIRLYGSNHGASRLSNLRLAVYKEAEAQLASWAGSEAAITLSSGFLAGQLVATYFSQQGFRAFYAPNAHAALVRGMPAPSTSYEALASALHEYLAGKKGNEAPILFMDSLDLSAGSYPFHSAIQKLPLEELILVADDSHGIGILGENGGGAYQRLAELRPKELLVCASLGKALGLQGGVILGSGKLLSKLWNTSFFAGASPSPPAHMATLTGAAKLYQQKRMALMENISLFESLFIQKTRFRHLEGYPVYGFRNEELVSFLESKNILLTYFNYPTSQADVLPGRIVLSACHRVADIQILGNALMSFFNELEG